MPASSDPCADPCPVLDYIDLMLLHSPLAGKERRLEAWRALVEARNKGKLRTIGVSNLYVTLPLERCSLYTHHICARLCSGVRHLEEIREAGLETPAVNQIEVCNRNVRMCLALTQRCTFAPRYTHYANRRRSWHTRRNTTSSLRHTVLSSAPTGLTRLSILAGRYASPTHPICFVRCSSRASEQYGKDPAQALVRWSLERG